MPAELEVSLETTLRREDAQLFEARDDRIEQRLVGEVDERRASPELECVAKRRGGALRVVALERPGALLREALEGLEVERLGFDA